MKKILFVAILSFMVFTTNAQELTWHTDMNKATELSLKKKKPLMLFFTGSDWCGWCIKLQKEVFYTDEFKKWANDNVILVELDFPKRKQLDDKTKMQNYELQQTFQVRGYPTVWFVNPEKSKDKEDKKINLAAIGSTGYVHGGSVKWIEGANTILSSKK